jgi:hypothetical protein
MPSQAVGSLQCQLAAVYKELAGRRRFICLLARSGLGVSNAACNDLMAVPDNFPIPVPLVVTRHNAEFNAHDALVRFRPEMILM